MTKFKHYSLRKYKGASSKSTCPQCGEKTWKPYVDEDGTPFSADFQDADPKIKGLAEQVGRCDNVRKCGWNYTPGQFFRETKTGTPSHNANWKAPPPPETAKPLDFSLVTRSFQPHRATFLQFLTNSAKMPEERLERVLKDYWIGADGHGCIAYWQIDIKGQCKDGKFMAYGPDGHRLHDVNPYFARNRLIKTYCRMGRISEQTKDKYLSMEVIRPYFGEHLLADPRYKDKPVALVEGEKSCIICSILNPRWIWMAVGTSTFNITKLLNVISQRRWLYIFPDLDQIDKWEAATKELKYKKAVFEGQFIKDNAQTEKDDVGDIMLRLWMENPQQFNIHDDTEEEAPEPAAAPMPESEPAAAVPEPEPMSKEEWLMDKMMQADVVEQALGLTEPSEVLRMLMVKLDLNITSDQEFDDEDYEGF